jgi:Dehydrogenases with different specificities (related to short-chain alcohol dehydrogenases)
LACANRLSADGYDVITVDRDPGCDFTVDVSDPFQVGTLVSAVPTLSVLVNSAGIVGPNKPLWEVSNEEWTQTFAVNVGGIFNTCRGFVPGMVEEGWGRIVNMASMAGKDGNVNLSAYSASKAAVIGLTKSLGKELATTGVLVNAIAPAVIETPMNAATAPEVLERLASFIPMKRLGRASEVAALVAWLASAECSFSTGAVYDISGGRATY